MKKNLRKLLSVFVTLTLVFALSLSVFAADISANKAKEIALENAGYLASDVLYLKAETDFDDGVKYYEVSFYVLQANGSYLEYDYEIGAADGKIYDLDIDREYKPDFQKPDGENGNTADKSVTLEQAKKIALEYFGLNKADVKFTQAEKDYDDGVLLYEISFAQGLDTEYSCEVIAANGLVKDAEKDTVRGLGDKIELFFEILFFAIFGR